MQNIFSRSYFMSRANFENNLKYRFCLAEVTDIGVIELNERLRMTSGVFKPKLYDQSITFDHQVAVTALEEDSEHETMAVHEKEHK